MRPPAEPVIRPAWARAIGLAFVALLVSGFAWWPMLAAYPATQNGDGQYFHRIVESARVSVTRYHELPLWNPFECGGVPLWDNPQSIIAAPLMWLSLLVGGNTTRGMELWYVSHSALGFAGMWLFARHELKASRIAAFFGATAWAFSGFHQHHDSGGHAAFVSFLYFPLALLLWRKAEKDFRAAIGLGWLFAWMIFEGAVYPLPHFGLLLAAEALTRAWPPRRFLAIVRAGVIVGLVALTVGGPRFLPVIDQLRAHTRSIGPEGDHLIWDTFKDMFLSRDHGRFVPGQQYVWTEYATYLGPVCLVFALIGFVTGGVELTWMAALLALSAALMCGHFDEHAPWSILKGHIFPFKEMRVPSRFRLEASFFVVAYASVAVDRFVPRVAWLLRSEERVRALRTVVVGMALLGAGDIVSEGIYLFPQFFTSSPETPVTPSERLYFGGAGQAAFLDQPRQNRGRLGCWDEWGFGEGAPLWEGDVPQALAVHNGDVAVEVGNRTQNTFTIDVDVKRPGRVRVNSTYDRGWQTDLGTLAEDNKELVLDLERPGRYRVHLRYWPRHLTLGFVLAALGLAGSIWAFRKRSSARVFRVLKERALRRYRTRRSSPPRAPS